MSKKTGGEHEFFPTPRWCCHRALERVPLPGGTWVEPMAGDGAIIRAVREVRSDILWIANELRTECEPDLKQVAHEVRIGSLFTPDGLALIARADVVIGNPAFSLAARAVEEILPHLRPHAVLLFLLRRGWVGSAERHDFLQIHMPDSYKLPDRPDFSGGGGASDEYDWNLWPVGMQYRPEGRQLLLARTPAAIRDKGTAPPPRQQALLLEGGGGG